ncbi:MAG: glycosyl hydrolase [Thermoleophilia bacterium]
MLAQRAPVPLIGITTDSKPPRHEAITPAGIAAGRGDAYLVAWNQAAADWGKLLYVRPMPEMDGYWTLYSAFTKAGKAKNAAHSTRAFRKAFARIYVILHGGTRTELDAHLRVLSLPPLQAGADLPVNPPSRLRVIWNPQGYPGPNIPANRPEAYYPGDAYVDVVGNDVYDFNLRPAWPENDRLYGRYAKKPYAFPEWGVWESDDPEFIRTMARFVRAHGRVELLVYNAGKLGSGSDLGSRPRSRAAYRASITPLGR